MTQSSETQPPSQDRELLTKIFDKLLSLEENLSNDINALDEKFSNQIHALDEKFSNQIDGLDRKINALDEKFTKQMEEMQKSQDGIDRKVSVWDGRLWGLSLILIGGAMSAFVAIVLAVGGLLFQLFFA